jgi:hypothetical protein
VLGDVTLDGEHVGPISIVILRPEVRLTSHVDQLRGDAQLPASPAYAALEDRADLQLAADLGDAFLGRLVLHDRGPRYHREVVQPR